MGGNQEARHNLGNAEGRAFNVNRALKHYLIAVGGGSSQSLKRIKQFYMNGLATKDDYICKSFESLSSISRRDQERSKGQGSGIQ
jgi:hypothetical protein